MRRELTLGLFLDYVLYLVVRLMEEVFNLLPERVGLATGRFLGRLIYVLVADRRDAAMENLTIAFGNNKSRAWIVRTARKSFEHLGMLGVEFFRIRRWTEQECAEKIAVAGRLNFNLATMPGNHGIVLLNSHFGCFEVSAATTKFLGFKLNLIQTGVKNPFLNHYFFTRAGEGDTGITTHPHRGVMRTMIERLKAGEMVACLADQRGDPERGCFVDYFGTKAPANEVFARMAIEGEAYVLPLCTFRKDSGQYQSVFGELIPIHLTADREADLVTVSQQFHNVFEEWLRAHPEQGFWVQRKWKRKPSRRRLRKRDDRAKGFHDHGKSLGKNSGVQSAH